MLLRSLQTTLFLLLLYANTAFAAVINGITVSGNQMTIAGTGFSGTPLEVTFNGTTVEISSNSATEIVTSIPPTSPGTYRVVVKVGKTTVVSSATIPAPAILFGQCYSGVTGGWIWLFGGEPCNNWMYPPDLGIPAPSAGVVSQLRAEGEFDGTVTLWVNDVETSLTCTISDNPPNLKSKCSDLTDQIYVNAGDELALGINATYGVSGARAAVEFTAQ